MQLIPVLLFPVFAALLVVSILIDRRKPRAGAYGQPISVIIPCYNDEATIAEAVESVFASWPEDRLDVQVIDDASTDGSRRVLLELARRYPLRLTLQDKNLGKAKSLHLAAAGARHGHLLFLDSDTELNREALEEMLSRLNHCERVGAVSCACTPKNRGFLPAMQVIEYNMHRLGMGASNLTSVPGLWGGCLITRRDLFLSMGGFKRNALTEDTDYAFRLNRAGHRVEQAFSQVKTEVPDRVTAWVRQKLRWAGGAFQCGVRYPLVLLKNPIFLAGLCVYALLAARGVSSMSDGVSGVEIVRELSELHQEGAPLPEVMGWLKSTQEGVRFLANLALIFFTALLSTLYVFPSVNSVRDLLKLFWLVPFMLGYVPVYMLVTAGGCLFWLFVLRSPARRRRAW